MHEDTIDTNRQVLMTDSKDSFFYRYRKFFFWGFLIILMMATWYFSRMLETRSSSTASVFLSGPSSLEIVELYAGQVIPTMVSVKVGDSIEFVVKDDNVHYIAERKTVSRRGDARISSGEFGPGESYSIQFNTPGFFSFYDRMNPDVSIDVEVR